MSTDGNPSYQLVTKPLDIEVGPFVASYDDRGGRGISNVQNVNAYDSRLEIGMGRFRGAATKHPTTILVGADCLVDSKTLSSATNFSFIRTELGLLTSKLNTA